MVGKTASESNWNYKYNSQNVFKWTQVNLWFLIPNLSASYLKRTIIYIPMSDILVNEVVIIHSMQTSGAKQLLVFLLLNIGLLSIDL